MSIWGVTPWILKHPSATVILFFFGGYKALNANVLGFSASCRGRAEIEISASSRVTVLLKNEA